MQIFITGTNTNIGKTLISSWLCLHSGYHYFKPIQTGSNLDSDTIQVQDLSKTTTYEEVYKYKEPLSPHLAARLENDEIDMTQITLEGKSQNLIIEGAGGVLVPLDDQNFMIDLIIQMQVSVIIIACSSIGTINHTLLTIEALRRRSIKILGVITNGDINPENNEAIEKFGKTKILFSFPKLIFIDVQTLKGIPISQDLIQILKYTT